MADLNGIMDAVREQGEAIQGFVARYKGRIESSEQRLDKIEAQKNRPGVAAGVFGPSGEFTPSSDVDRGGVELWRDVKTGRDIRVVGRGGSVVAERSSDPLPSMGRVLRGLVLGGQAADARELEEERKALSIATDPAGGYTVSGALSGQWIDALRANMVLASAGVRTVPMDGAELTLARLTADPTAYWRNENAEMLGADPTFGAVRLRAKTVACLVKLSLELSQDSKNIEEILQTALTRALAQAIDEAGLVGTTDNAAAAPAGIFNLAGRNSVTSIGAPTSWDFALDGMYELMADNVPADRIGALIGHPALWRKLAKLKTGLSGDNTALAAPAEVARLPKLWTTAAPLSGSTAKAVLGDWTDYLFGVRMNIGVRVIQEALLSQNLQVGVLAYARVDFAATREQSFCTLEGITVS